LVLKYVCILQIEVGLIVNAVSLVTDFYFSLRFFKITNLYGVEIPLGCLNIMVTRKLLKRLINICIRQIKVLKNNGNEQFGEFTSYIYVRVLRNMSRTIRNFTIKLGITDNTPICIYSGLSKGWQIKNIN